MFSVGSCCKASKFPVAKSLKVERGISAIGCQQIHRQHTTVYSPCFCLLFFSPGSVMQICKSPFVRFPAECNIFWGDLHIWMTVTPLHTKTQTYTIILVQCYQRIQLISHVLLCEIRECSSLIKMSHNRATIHCHTMSP